MVAELFGLSRTAVLESDRHSLTQVQMVDPQAQSNSARAMLHQNGASPHILDLHEEMIPHPWQEQAGTAAVHKYNDDTPENIKRLAQPFGGGLTDHVPRRGELLLFSVLDQIGRDFILNLELKNKINTIQRLLQFHIEKVQDYLAAGH